MSRCEFEGIFNWDVVISDLWFSKIQCTCDRDKMQDGDVCNCPYEDGDTIDDEYALSNIHIELKPLLGDDYPCVLRKMKTQIELTLNKYEKIKQDMLDRSGYVEGKHYAIEYGSKFYQVKDTLDYINDNYRKFLGDFVLLIKEFNSNNTTKEQLIEIFKQSGIRVVFVDDVFGNSPTQTPQLRCLTDLSADHQNTKEENELLKSKLLQAEEKIKQLEDEILSFKNQQQSKPQTKTQNKSIKDYFKK